MRGGERGENKKGGGGAGGNSTKKITEKSTR